MVKMLFFIRFRGQLRRTKPELVASLEDTISGAVTAAGGSTETGRRILGAVFDEDRIGFWLDMVIFLGKVHKALDANKGELYGYAVALCRDDVRAPQKHGRRESAASMEELCRFFSGRNRSRGTGIWCSPEIREALEPYTVFGPYAGAEGESIAGEFRELGEWKSFDRERKEYPYQRKIERTLRLKGDKNTLFLGPEFIGKRDGIYRYCETLLGEVPPLIVRFGAGTSHADSNGPGPEEPAFPRGGHGLVFFADAFTPERRAFISAALPGKMPEYLDAAAAKLSRERLREEWSPSTLEESRRFIGSLLAAYTGAAKTRLPRGVLILEDISLAGSAVVGLFRDVYSSLDDKEGLLVLAADSCSDESLKSWKGFFPGCIRTASDSPHYGETIIMPREQTIPAELWELSCNISLLGRYFPASLFPRLFEEEGLSRELFFRAAGLLTDLGAIEGGDPRLRIPDFVRRSEDALGERKEKIRSAVRKRILAWTKSGGLSYCFNLLRVLKELGEQAGDALILRAIKADVLNGTTREIEEAHARGRFASLVGAGNAPVLTYIYRTLKALVWGDEDEIARVFETPVPSFTLEDGSLCYGAYRAQVYVNLASCYIGTGNFDAAAESIRKTMLLNRELGESAVPAYRLFSLVNLSRRRIDDALEYITFAMDQAELLEQKEELALTCYFASSINLLYGNLSRAERLAKKAGKTASELGQPGWAARAGFLNGRVLFEIGRYADALEVFESLYPGPDVFAGPEKTGQPGMADTVRAWINRTGIFLGRPFPGGDAPGGIDGRLFEIEAAYYAADYEKTAALAGAFLSSAARAPESSGNGFLFTEQPDWRSGFAQCENMFQPGTIPGTGLAWVYMAMAKCALGPDAKAKAELLGGMQRFMRDTILPDTDPNDAFYFYAWYRMLRDTGAAQVDMNTVLSMAHKRLQKRAARIDDESTKQAFLTLPRWNNSISLAAREYKLI